VFLKSLTLKGFKSFADPTTLELEPGVTVVVGPNGSGKSNIVDAVAWVLGAQASRAIRSNKMEDVIFAGTSKRPALGRAEVSLTIDNTSGTLPIGFTEVTITRTLFRSGESEYAINGVSCRLLDIQELLSDSGVGRQQHVIIGQGQLAAILDSRPEDRRAVIEEAAGVLKFRRRRERAQRRLESTEANFVRLADLLREIRRQLRPLERQADAARRYEGLVEELRALRVFLAGRELASLQVRAEAHVRQKTDLAEVETDLRKKLGALDADVMTAESALSSAGGGVNLIADVDALQGWDGIDVADALARCEAVYQKARGLLAFLGERRRSIERDRNSFMDSGVVANLESEAARIKAELERVRTDSIILPPHFEELAEQEEALTADRARFLDEWGNDEVPANEGPSAGQVKGELGGARQAVGATEQELQRVSQRLASLVQRVATLVQQQQQVQQSLSELDGVAAAGDSADGLSDPAVTRETAERVLVEADALLNSSQDRLRADEGEEKRLGARVEALTTALDAARARAGAKRLAGIDGIVGTLLDLVDIDEGCEAAVEAAFGESIAAVVVENGFTARAALTKLSSSNESGAVLALDALSRSGVTSLDVAAVPGIPVRRHVRARNTSSQSVQQVEGLLDSLLGASFLVDGDWGVALDVAIAHPTAVVVTRSGDRFSAFGWRAGAGATGATGAALDEASVALVAATAAADGSRAALQQARDAQGEARRTLDVARQHEQQAIRDRDRAASRLGTLRADVQRVAADLADREAEHEATQTQVSELQARAIEQRRTVESLEAQLPGLIAAEDEIARRQAERRNASQRLDERAQAIASQRRDLEVQVASLEERGRVLQTRQVEIDERLSRSIAERAEAETRRIELDQQADRTEALHAIVQDQAESIESGLTLLRDERRRQSEAARAATGRLEALRRDRAGAEKHLGEIRERQARVDLEQAETRLRLETLVEQIRREFDVEPEATLSAECPPLENATAPTTRVKDLERELRLMGPINPLALEEFNQLQERHTLIESQLEDVRNSRRELAKVIKAIDEEIITVFAAAYADVAENFSKLFGMLFPGGSGGLRLTDPDNPLDTGVEVEARPSGKNVRKLSLLSGGERSLTALAFLFAVFRSRPSPFYLMDEVEAALDDVNLSRFLGLVAEFRNEAQLLIVSHQKRTMEAADCLYGVTMQPGGSSKAVSEKVRKVAAVAATKIQSTSESVTAESVAAESVAAGSVAAGSVAP
jgi:chromosome segregation protein